ncbi:T7-like capsid assembly protein [uncultured phage_MedDCM-OCT-S45-C4]|uniref:T7-like capsid assembly protein n=1 Tax=uncultured phage_MedDCM-OCT-S45-C4 TaxID=2740801 RepID=A0A6S4P9K2_9CAUD|nr:head assembly [uncultured phage_MedDCM-OCT-S45-C4]BAQ93982.1 T7-like capsid assembly protein [uncultured phage_MedDCM-OCT-S45-C4]
MAEILTYDPSTDPQAIQSAEERDAESLAVGQALEDQQNQLLAGKYKSAQDLEQAYIELQKKLGSDDQKEVAEQEAEPAEEADETISMFNSIDDELAEAGKISEESMAKLSAMDSKDLVDAYFRYQDTLDDSPVEQGRELNDQEVTSIYQSVGGQQQYQQMTEWAAENLDANTVQAFDNVIESGDVATINLALRGLQSQYNDNVGYENNMIQGKPAQASGGYRSQAEVVRDMNDPRYDRDPAFRQEVMSKLSNSPDLQF